MEAPLTFRGSSMLQEQTGRAITTAPTSTIEPMLAHPQHCQLYSRAIRIIHTKKRASSSEKHTNMRLDAIARTHRLLIVSKSIDVSDTFNIWRTLQINLQKTSHQKTIILVKYVWHNKYRSSELRVFNLPVSHSPF